MIPCLVKNARLSPDITQLHYCHTMGSHGTTMPGMQITFFDVSAKLFIIRYNSCFKIINSRL